MNGGMCYVNPSFENGSHLGFPIGRDGRFFFSPARDGHYRLVLPGRYPPTLLDEEFPIVIENMEHKRGLVFEVEHTPHDVSFAGLGPDLKLTAPKYFRVVDEGGTPVSGVVCSFGGDIAANLSDGEGRVAFEKVEFLGNSTRLDLLHPLYLPRHVDFEVNGTKDVVLTKAPTVKWRVRTMDSYSPITNYYLTFKPVPERSSNKNIGAMFIDDQRVSHPHGIAALRVAMPGGYNFAITAPGFEEFNGQITVSGDVPMIEVNVDMKRQQAR